MPNDHLFLGLDWSFIKSLNDKNEISFNDESIVYHSTQNDGIKLDSSAEINIRIDKLLAPIRRSNRLKEKGNLT